MANDLKSIMYSKQAITHQQLHNQNIRHQIVHNVYPIFPNDKIFNKIIKMFVGQDHNNSNDKYYSRAISGEPICAYIQTDKESWLAAITRSVKIEWPALEYSEASIIERLMGFISSKYTRYEGNFCRCRVHSVDIDGSVKEESQKGYKVIRNTECHDFLVFPLNGKLINYEKGFRILSNNNGTKQIKALGSNIEYQQRVKEVFSPDILLKLIGVYTTIEKDPKSYEKYIKGEIVGEPVDFTHPVMSFHATVYKENPLATYGGWGNIPGVLPVDINGNIYHRETRVEIPPPQNGARLLYKSEIPLLNSRLSLQQIAKARDK